MLVQVQGLPQCRDVWKFNFSTTYFMELYKGPRGNNVKIFESEYWVDDLDKAFELEFEDSLLCNADQDCPIEFKFINRNQYQMVNTEIAHVVTSVKALEAAHGRSAIECRNSQKEGSLARLRVSQFKKQRVPAFTDYLKEGWEIALMGAIDFTYSNGNPSNPTSLHHISDELNHYEQAIQAVGKILCDYDSDHQYPFYGFGGAPQFMGQNYVSHCFPLNGNESLPEIKGIDEVLRQYRQVVPRVKLLGPTYFAPIIARAREQV